MFVSKSENIISAQQKRSHSIELIRNFFCFRLTFECYYWCFFGNLFKVELISYRIYSNHLIIFAYQQNQCISQYRLLFCWFWFSRVNTEYLYDYSTFCHFYSNVNARHYSYVRMAEIDSKMRAQRIWCSNSRSELREMG